MVTFLHQASLNSVFSVLLFDTGHELKLCDFGTATKIEHTLTNGVGTVRYMAPEVIKGIQSCVLCTINLSVLEIRIRNWLAVF